MLFSLESLLNCYLEKKRGCHAIPKEQLKRAITFNLTAGLRSNFHKSFRRLFSMECLWNCYLVKMKSGRVTPEQ
jgi:hypothetical protein